MPYCEVGRYRRAGDGAGGSNEIKIFYRTYGHGPIKVLMIIGLAGTHDSWGPQIQGLVGTSVANDVDFPAADGEVGNGSGFQICAFDNRGVGRSSVPWKKSEYTTRIMAKDAIAVLDHLGWKRAHIFGHSMGAMIACKLAALVPDRILSLALLNVTGGGYECLPKIDRRTLSIAIRFLRAKTPEQRAAVDLDTHYTMIYLDEYVGTEKRGAILYQFDEQKSEGMQWLYLNGSRSALIHQTCASLRRCSTEYVKGISASGMQSNYGFDGQINACWTHKILQAEFDVIRYAGFLISVIHGSQDVVAQLYYATRLAEKLHPFARMVELHGGHLVSHERPEEVNQALLDLIRASEKKMNPLEWTNMPKKSSGWAVKRISFSKANSGTASDVYVNSMEKIKLFLLYLFGLFVWFSEYVRRAVRSLKPVRVGPALT